MSERFWERVKNVWCDEMIDTGAADARVQQEREKTARHIRDELLARVLEVKADWQRDLADRGASKLKIIS